VLQDVTLRCSVLQCFAVCCSVLQCVAVRCILTCPSSGTRRHTLDSARTVCVAHFKTNSTCTSTKSEPNHSFSHYTLQDTARHCKTLQHSATHSTCTSTESVPYSSTSHLHTSRYCQRRCNTLQHTATHCNTLQHTVLTRRCKTLQHTIPSRRPRARHIVPLPICRCRAEPALCCERKCVCVYM